MEKNVDFHQISLRIILEKPDEKYCCQNILYISDL